MFVFVTLQSVFRFVQAFLVDRTVEIPLVYCVGFSMEIIGLALAGNLTQNKKRICTSQLISCLNKLIAKKALLYIDFKFGNLK